MHFGLSDEQELLQQTVRDFAAKELPAQRLRDLFDEASGFDEALWRGLSQIGLIGLAVPEEYGGAGLELLDLALLFEVLGEAAMPGPFLGHALSTLALTLGGSPEQKQRWLPQLAAGEAIGAIALCEDGGLWEPNGWKLALDGGALAGAKGFVEYADRADVIVVGTAGGGLALVEKGASGMTCETIDSVDRTRSLHRVAFSNTPAEAMAGGERVAEAVNDAGRILLAADAFGGAWKLIRTTVDYMMLREQYDTPLAQFQAVKHNLANLAVETEPMRGLIWYAAHAFDHIPDERAQSAAIAKAHVTDTAVDVARDCVNLHGGIGFTWECDVHFWLKRAMFDRTWLGNPGWHYERIAALGGL